MDKSGRKPLITVNLLSNTYLSMIYLNEKGIRNSGLTKVFLVYKQVSASGTFLGCFITGIAFFLKASL